MEAKEAKLNCVVITSYSKRVELKTHEEKAIRGTGKSIPSQSNVIKGMRFVLQPTKKKV